MIKLNEERKVKESHNSECGKKYSVVEVNV